jgi:hypothetical protein
MLHSLLRNCLQGETQSMLEVDSEETDQFTLHFATCYSLILFKSTFALSVGAVQETLSRVQKEAVSLAPGKAFICDHV